MIALGPTVTFPLHGTTPTPWSMLQMVALLVDQARFEFSGGVAPRSMVVGLAVNVAMVGGQAGQVIICPQLFWTVPHWPAQAWTSLSHPQTPGVPPPPQR